MADEQEKPSKPKVKKYKALMLVENGGKFYRKGEEMAFDASISPSDIDKLIAKGAIEEIK